MHIQVRDYPEGLWIYKMITDWFNPEDDYSIRNLTIESETDWRYCFPTLNMHIQRVVVTWTNMTKMSK